MRQYVMLFLLVTATMAVAEETPKLDPRDIVNQLYALSSKSWKGAASYTVYSDGTVGFSVEVKKGQSVYGSGATPEDALQDLRRQSDVIAATVVIEAERTQTSAKSLVEGIKALLFGNRNSQ